MRRPVRAIAAATLALAAVAGVAVGGVSLGREGPTARAWARLHPHRALAADAPRVAAAVASIYEARGRPPRHPDEVLEALADAPLAYLRWSEDGALLDPWGRPMQVKIHRLTALGVSSLRVYSTGPDGVDDAGFHDDVELDLGFAP